MSIHTTFPDAIVFPDSTIRLVTRAAKQWAYTNTNINRWCDLSTVPDYVDYEDSVAQALEDNGFALKRERQPVGHYRSKRKTPVKENTSNDSEDEFDRHRARFEGLTVEEYRRQIEMCRGYGRHRARNWRLMQERDERRKHQEMLQDEQTDQ